METDPPARSDEHYWPHSEIRFGNKFVRAFYPVWSHAQSGVYRDGQNLDATKFIFVH